MKWDIIKITKDKENSSMEDLKKYKDGLQFKKVLFGGFDKRDVQDKVNELYNMAGRNMAEQKAKEDVLLTTIAGQEEKIEMQEAEIKELQEKQVKMREAYKEYCETILQQYGTSLRSLSSEFTRILDDVVSLQKEIVSIDVYAGLDKALEVKETPVLPENEEVIFEE